MSDPTRKLLSQPTQRRVPRWMFVAAAVGVIGVTIDLLQGPAANALPMPAARVSAMAALPGNDTLVAQLVDAAPMEPGASVAAYDASADTAAAQATAPAERPQVGGDALEPGASVAAYDR